MIKYVLSHYVDETVVFCRYGCKGYRERGTVIRMGDNSPGISSGIEIIPARDIKKVRRYQK